jgi:hypothetical protein
MNAIIPRMNRYFSLCERLEKPESSADPFTATAVLADH